MTETKVGPSEVVKALLTARGITSEADIAAFLNPDYEGHTHSPLLLDGMGAAVSRILKAIDRKERIAIYADFDCDGIPGAAVLHDFFHKIGYTDISVYIPHRDREGYGFHTEAINELAEREVKLIITVDVGTNASEAVLYARTQGVDVIVTDHHEVMGELPQAVAVLNPKIPSTDSGQVAYPFPHLCGAAMVFKLVQATILEGRKRKIKEFTSITNGWEKWLLDLVAIATVADMVPLVGENRVFVHWGLRVLRKSPRPGIVALCNVLRLKRSELTENDIGFSIGPRINAASRMDNPDLAFQLLTTRDTKEAESLATQLEALNSSRKGVVGGIVREARRRMKDRFTDADRIIVLGNPEWKPSLMGLAANSILGERGGVVCLWGRDALGRIKGSGRSDGSVSLVDLFTEAKDSFEEFGGHVAAGGFSVVSERVHTLHEDLVAALSRLDLAGRPSREIIADISITIPEVSWTLFRDLEQLAPFGVGNPKPIVRVQRMKVTQLKRFGKEKNHVELMLSCTETQVVARAYDFFRSPQDFTHEPSTEAEATILATIEKDTFRGGLALRLLDVLRV